MEKVDDVTTFETIKQINLNTNHKLEENMLYAYRNANKLTDDVWKKINEVIENCDVCKKFSRSPAIADKCIVRFSNN